MIQADDRLKGLFDEAIKIARKNNHEYITLEHLLSVLLLQPEVVDMVKDKPTVKPNIYHNQNGNWILYTLSLYFYFYVFIFYFPNSVPSLVASLGF